MRKVTFPARLRKVANSVVITVPSVFNLELGTEWIVTMKKKEVDQDARGVRNKTPIAADADTPQEQIRSSKAACVAALRFTPRGNVISSLSILK